MAVLVGEVAMRRAFLLLLACMVTSLVVISFQCKQWVVARGYVGHGAQTNHLQNSYSASTRPSLNTSASTSASTSGDVVEEAARATSRETEMSATMRYVREKDQNNRTFILSWRRPWGALREGWKEGAVFGECVVTNKKERIRDAAAVIFHYSGLDEERMPWKHYRDPEQLFVFYFMESPAYMFRIEKRKNFLKFDNFVNWTMSYRHDSDVLFSYVRGSSLRDFLSHWRRNLPEMMRLKKRVALWVVSNCNANFGSTVRMDYVEKLVAAGLPVSRYGNCFNNRKEFAAIDVGVLLSFKFYLAFENSRYCRYYVTEKFWTNGVLMWRVPVVLGAAKDEVAMVTPTKSFIHVDDFDSPEELTSYLLYLHGNATAYREYFRWVEHRDAHTADVIRRYLNNRMDLLCDMVTSQRRVPRKTIANVTRIVYDDENEECLRN